MQVGKYAINFRFVYELRKVRFNTQTVLFSLLCCIMVKFSFSFLIILAMVSWASASMYVEKTGSYSDVTSINQEIEELEDEIFALSESVI